MSVENILLPKRKYDQLLARLTQRELPERKTSQPPETDEQRSSHDRPRKIRPTPVESDDNVIWPSDTGTHDNGGRQSSPITIIDENVEPAIKNVEENNNTSTQRTLEEIYENHKSFLPPGDTSSSPDYIAENVSDKKARRKKTNVNVNKNRKTNSYKAKPRKKPYSALKTKWLTL